MVGEETRQKMEALGQLAAGVAHEINNPLQYIVGNTQFLLSSFNDIADVLEYLNQLSPDLAKHGIDPEHSGRLQNMIHKIDLGFLIHEIPAAAESSLKGLTNVTEIVQAMKEFAHPGSKEKIPDDINHIIRTSITVSKNQWKYVADMELDLDPQLPDVFCLTGEISQVILNLLINSTHALEAQKSKGTIKIRTKHVGPFVEICIEDDGPGIPAEIQDKIFEPFFTSKEKGKGSGQGLALARTIVEENHNGSINFESEPEKGTSFIIRIPIVPEEESLEAVGS